MVLDEFLFWCGVGWVGVGMILVVFDGVGVERWSS